ncbi:FGGY family carbohydrate kinase, partial [Calditrichota bacterium]
MLYNIHTLEWDEELLQILDIPHTVLPEVVPSSKVYGTTDKTVFGIEIPIAGIAGDQQAALFGQGCFNAGSVKNTYGTGAFMVMNTGEFPVMSQHRLLSSIAWQIEGETTYLLEGSVFIGGAVVQWLRDKLGIIQSAAEVEELALKVDSNGGVYFVPAFVGLGAPHWDPTARGIITGLGSDTNTSHIARAALEAIAFQTNDVLQAMQNDSGYTIDELKVDGGASNNNLLMQFQSDIMGTVVLRPTNFEMTALGAAYLAGLAVGIWQDLSEISGLYKHDRKFTPHMQEASREKLLQGWNRALSRSKFWVS